jgi:hypothetical protein
MNEPCVAAASRWFALNGLQHTQRPDEFFQASTDTPRRPPTSAYLWYPPPPSSAHNRSELSLRRAAGGERGY